MFFLGNFFGIFISGFIFDIINHTVVNTADLLLVLLEESINSLFVFDKEGLNQLLIEHSRSFKSGEE
jgi:hypothetical protein